jgi:hypothetical protein
MNTSRVFVVQDDGTKDLVPATVMGDLIVLHTRNLSPFIDPEPVLKDIRYKLDHHAFCHDDWLLLIGDPLLIGAATYYAARITGGVVSCLKWDNRHRKYFPIKLNL